MSDRHDYVHGEAFMLMAYDCRACRVTEVVWNSRDGVTPYLVSCRACGGEARHVAWSADVRAPGHTPDVGDRVFIDLHPEKALQQRRAYVEEWWDHPEMPMCEHPYLGPLGKDGAAADLAKADMESFAPHTPDLVEVDEAVLTYLKMQQAGRDPEIVEMLDDFHRSLREMDERHRQRSVGKSRSRREAQRQRARDLRHAALNEPSEVDRG